MHKIRAVTTPANPSQRFSIVEPFRVVNRAGAITNACRFDNRERYIAQSVLTSCDILYLPTLEEARDIVAWADRGVRA